MKKGKKKEKKRDKKGYKKCSVKKCRKKVVIGGKCRKHAQKKLPPRRALKKISASSLHHTARKIRRLSDSVSALSKRAEERASCSKEGYLNALFFEAGVISEKISRLIKQDQ